MKPTTVTRPNRRLVGAGYAEPVSDAHTLMESARIAAQHAAAPWAYVQRVYQALQAEDLFPKSSGRAVYAAHPNLMAELLIGMAGSPNPDAAPDFVRMSIEWSAKKPLGVTSANPDEGVPLHEFHFNQYLGHLLSSPKLAARVEVVELQPDMGKAIIHWRDNKPAKVFASAKALKISPQPIRFRGVIDGALLVALAENVRWKVSGNPTIKSRGVDAET